MYLKTLKLLNFKNYIDADIELSPKINCFTGLNGSGKTNLLDAVFYLSFTKGHFNTSDAQNINYDSDYFMISGDFIKNDKKESIYCGYKKGQKKIFKRNDKAYKRFSEHIGLLPAIMITPDDNILITGTAEERRKYINSVISQYDKAYLEELIKYNRILAQRNKLLKDFAKFNYFDTDTIDVYNMQLVKSGKIIYQKRREFTEKLQPVFQEFYSYISEDKEQVGFTYKSQLNDTDYAELLKSTSEKDRILQYTSAGTHRDDLVFKLGQYSIRKFGSQGQQKTFLIALKLAQFEFIKTRSGVTPILLLDDIFDKFDAERVSRIIKLTGENKFGQILITDTNYERVKRILSDTDADYKVFEVEKGVVSEMDS